MCLRTRYLKAPDIMLMYDGTAVASCAPAYLQLLLLFTHFNEIVHARFTTHSNLRNIVNAFILFYGMDKGLTFILKLDQCQFNHILIVIIWTAISAGNEANVQKYAGPGPMLLAYVAAWLEYMSSTDVFAARKKFLDEWIRSEHDILWFTASNVRRFREGVKKLQQQLGPATMDPVEYIKRCTGDAAHIGPANALRTLLVQAKTAELEAKKRRKCDKALEAMQGEFGSLKTSDEMCSRDDEDNEDNEGGKALGTESHMDIDSRDELALPPGYDLTLVPCHNELLQALLSVDPTIPTDDPPQQDTR